jgi:hypothetical protein
VTSASRIEPPDVVQAVERYVDSELRDAAQYENSAPLDEDGVWSLHTLAAEVYALGYQDGERAESERSRRAAQRKTP